MDRVQSWVQGAQARAMQTIGHIGCGVFLPLLVLGEQSAKQIFYHVGSHEMAMLHGGP